MIDKIIKRYKDMRSRAFLRNVYNGQYAFVGIGGHSLTNLYPVLQYLQVPLKYICCRSEEKAALIEAKYKGVKATASLSEILSDNEVKGVFVSASPNSHFAIARQVLQSGKHLFIEKPPCQSLEELEQLCRLAEERMTIAMVGLQKRYSPVMSLLKKRLAKERIISYNAKYLTGSYPEGNALLDLFIHPIDALVYLFGKAEIIGMERTHGTILLTLHHKDIIGMVELSTDYSWTDAEESLCVNTAHGTYVSRQMGTLIFRPKSGTLLGIPREKIFTQQPTTIDLLHRNNFVPTLANNQVYTQGYFGEIKAFVDAVEGKGNNIKSQLDSLADTYSILECICKLCNSQK